MQRTHPRAPERPRPYATGADFLRVFADNMESLHLLAFLLTADEVKAEVSFVSGFENCVETNVVFRDWAHSWARRTIVQNTVRMLSPRRCHGAAKLVPKIPTCCRFVRTAEAETAIAGILGLEDFERFVFVLSVLCGYSDQDCSILMGCSRQDVREARILAQQHIAESRCIPTKAGSVTAA